MALCRHVHASVLSRRVMRRSWGCSPVDRRRRGYSGIARSVTGYWRFAASCRAALCHCQRSATDEQRDDPKCFHTGHFSPPNFDAWRGEERGNFQIVHQRTPAGGSNLRPGPGSRATKRGSRMPGRLRAKRRLTDRSEGNSLKKQHQKRVRSRNDMCGW